MVEFKNFTRDENSTLEDLGTLKSIVGKGGKIALIRKNWADTTKRVAILLTKKDGTSAVVPCSKQVSESLRNGKMNLAQLIGLNVVSNEEGHNFVSMPATGAIQEFAVDGLKEKEFEAKEEFLPENLIAF